MTSPWYVVHTHSNAEGRALDNLMRQGFQTYLPRYRKRRSHAGRVEMVLRPLFPRYLFVAFDPEAVRWRAILSTFGVADLIRRGERPTPLPAGVVDSLQAQEAAGGLMPREPDLRPGEPVRVVEGPFAEFVGRVIALKDSQRVTILLDLLGRSVKAQVTTEQLVRA